MSNYIFSCGLTAIAVFALLAPAAAQTPPPRLDPAGSAQQRSFEQRQEIEQEQKPRAVIEEPVQIEEPPAPPPISGPEDFSFTLKGVRIDESAFLSEEALADIIRPYLNRTVGIAELERLVDAINQQYRQQGIATAQAMLLPQEIEDGIIRIDLIEGRLGRLRLNGNHYTDRGFLLNRTGLKPDAVVDTRKLQQALIRFNRTSEIQLQAALQPGADFGLTDIQITVEEPPRNTVQVFADNQGTDSTGLYQLGLLARRNGLLGRDDQASLYMVGAEGTLTGSLGYGIAVNRYNGRLDLTYARNKIDIVKGPFKSLDITGKSSTLMLNFTQPLYVSERTKWDGTLSLSRAESETRIGGSQLLNDSSVNKLSAGAIYEHSGYFGRWLTRHTIHAAQTDAAFGANEEERTVTGYSGALSWLRPFVGCCTAVVNSGWQFLSDSQPPASEQFQIGGLGSVRGYVPGLLADARGYFVQLELHRPLWQGLAGFMFVDNGAVAPESSDSITGVGLGLNYRYNRWLNVDISYGAALDRDVIPDQDAGRIDARVVLNFHP
jgi:hemolysin activation/secretion protein